MEKCLIFGVSPIFVIFPCILKIFRHNILDSWLYPCFAVGIFLISLIKRHEKISKGLKKGTVLIT